IRFHKSIIKEKTVDIIHKMDFVYSLGAPLGASFLHYDFPAINTVAIYCDLSIIPAEYLLILMKKQNRE
ncbi:hypothetical protein ABQE23_13230, partial [Enterococcus avium]|uniref:hypothetical protein n=1 Tax=Enterococcus avium TaxID=33945 RepID=UPI0032E4A945